MQHAQLTDVVRQRVSEVFAELQLEEPDQYRETILIRGGNYCGRRFEVLGGHAIWFVEENQLKFYGPDGGLIRVVQPNSATPIAARFAA